MISLLLGAVSGVLVGFVLGLVGGGGSILAVPLLVHLVGVPSPHLAIGTSAVAVAINAVLSLAVHARRGSVKWRCAALFSASGVLGAAGGSLLGRMLDGQKLIAAFGVLMLLVGAALLVPRQSAGQRGVRLTMLTAGRLAPRLITLGVLTGSAAGFFGIGGGFLIVPALVLATDMPLDVAVGSSLVAVAAFGVTTAVSYASAGLVDWTLAAVFIVGGAVGGLLGESAMRRLSGHKRALSLTFAGVVLSVGAYVTTRGIMALR